MYKRQDYIKEYVENKVPEFTKIDKLQYMSKEGYYYYKTFKKYYPDLKPIPHYWMPRWQDQDLNDPSGRKIKIFND